MTIQKVGANDEDVIKQIVALGDQARNTLGLLPREAYFDAAEKGCLLAAIVDGEAAGYALFRLPRNEVVLTHLCVRPDLRRAGIAAELVDEIQRSHEHRLGIKAKCRDDYGLAATWESLGFSYRISTVGRGRDRAPMTVWWRDHGHPDLFTPPMDEPTRVRAALATDVLRELEDPLCSEDRSQRSQLLRAEHLQERVEYVATKGLDEELTDNPGDDPHVRDLACAYQQPGDQDRAAELRDVLMKALQAAEPMFPHSSQDRGAVWQLAEVAAAGAHVLLTWDDRLLDQAVRSALSTATEPELAQLRVVDPNHLEIRLNELEQVAAYSPDRLAGSWYTTVPAGSDAHSGLAEFLDTQGGETQSQFIALLGDLARDKIQIPIVHAEDDTSVACYATVMDDNVLRVPLLRVADHPMTETLTRQILWLLRREARGNAASVVQIDDPHLPVRIQRIAAAERYIRSGGQWYAVNVDRSAPSHDIVAAATNALELVGLPKAPLIQPNVRAATAAEFERLWWPAKITDSTLPHYVVPIQQRWSSELLGYPKTLLPRPTELSLSREHVYYRSGSPSCLHAPGRILWYMSGGDSVNDAPGAFIGTSLLDAVYTGSPEELYSTYSRYGVFSLEDVRRVQNSAGHTQALQVSDTELFPCPVQRHTYQELRTQNRGGPQGFQSPMNLPTSLFAMIYQHGHNR